MIFEHGAEILGSFVYVLLALIILLLAKIAKDLVTPYKIEEELTVKDNAALGLSLTGYFAGVVIVFLGATIGDDVIDFESLGPLEALKIVGLDAAWALAGIVFLNFSRIILDKLVLSKFSTQKEIIEDRNVGAGAVEFGSYVSCALVIGGAIYGEGGGPLTALAFFGLGQVALIAFVFIYQLITKYDIHAEIEKDNTAAGTALGGVMIAIGIILFKAASEEFVGWRENLIDFGLMAGIGFALMAALHKITDHVFLPKTSLSKEIAEDRNTAAAWIESVITIGMAAVIYFMI